MNGHTTVDNALNTLQSQTRAERKRLEREAKKKKATYNMTAEQLHQIKVDAYKEEEKRFNEVRAELINTAISVILNTSCVVLHDEFGLGPKRLQQYSDRMMSQLECITEGYVSLDDLKTEKEKLEKRSKIDVVMVD